MTKYNDDDYFSYLLQLRDSGETNMWGAAPYIVREFGVTYSEAKEILMRWIKSFDKQ